MFILFCRAYIRFGDIRLVASSYHPYIPSIFRTIVMSECDDKLLLVGLDSALVSIRKDNGSLTMIAGDPIQDGYREGRGTEARFTAVSGIVELDHHYVVADIRNNCLRSISYQSGSVTASWAGECKERSESIDGDLNQARFYRPKGLQKDPLNDNLVYVLEVALVRRIDLGRKIVQTVAGPARTSSDMYMEMTISPNGSLVLSLYGGIIMLHNGNVEVLAGNNGWSNTPCNACQFPQSTFISATQAIFLTASVLLMAERNPHSLRLLNLTGGDDITIGNGKGFVDGYYQQAKFTYPMALAADDSHIYIGENAREGGGLRKLEYSGKQFRLKRKTRRIC